MSVYELIELSREMAYSGRDYLEIKREVQAHDIDEEGLKKVMRQADEFIVNYQLASQTRAALLNQMIVGLAVLVIGLAFFGYTYFSGGNRYAVPLAIVLAGYWWFRKNYRRYRRPVEELLPRTKETYKSKFQRF